MFQHFVPRCAKAVLLSLVFATCALGAEEEFNSAAVGVYQDPGLNLNRDFSGGGQVDEVDPFSGALKMVVRDLFLPGNGGLDISVIRNYQSVTNDAPVSNGHTHRTVFGTGWDMHFGRILLSNTFSNLSPVSNNSGCMIKQEASNLNPILELPDGSRHVLASGDGVDHAFITKSRWIGRCLPPELNKNAGGLLVYSPEGLKYIFNIRGTVSPDKSGLSYFVSRIEDPQGNYLDFTYTPPPANATTQYILLKKIVASDGRLVEFNYAGVNNDVIGLRPVLSSVRGGGRTINYIYVDATWYSGTNWLPHYLESVAYPDGTKWSYTYNHRSSQLNFIPGRFSIATMTSPTGLKTSYAYDYRQMGNDPKEKLNVITRRTLSGVTGSTSSDHVWQYQYTKGYSPNNDKTMVIAPTQCIRYEHVGSNSISTAWALNRGLWKIGLLVKKEIIDRSGLGCGTDPGHVRRTETLVWGSQDITAQNEMRLYGLIEETETRAPLLLKKIIQQDGSSYTTDYTYDKYGQPIKTVESGQKTRTTTVAYVRPGGRWMLGKVASQTISGVSGSIANSYYPSTGKLSQEDRFGVITKYTYFGSGDLASQTDANNRVTNFADYYRGVPKKVTYPDGAVVNRVVNTRGTIASETDPLDRITTYTYDSMDRLASVTPPKGADSRLSISYGFGSTGVAETLTRGVYKRVRQFNQLGQLIAQTESGGSAAIVVTAKYNPSGQKTFVSNPNYGLAGTLGENFSYDTLGRLTRITHADGTYVSMTQQSGNKVAVIDERSNPTTQSYAAYGEPDERVLIGISQPGGVQTALTVDNLGRVTAITQGGLPRSFVFNAKGFLDSETHPETGKTQYTHDAVGNVLTKKVGSAPADGYSYDSRYRLTKVTYGGSGLVLSNSYDKGGRLLNQSHAGTTWSYTYDAHDNLASETLALTTPARSYKFSYAYNALDALVSLTYPSGLLVDYAPDVYGRPNKAGAFASGLSYHPNGVLKVLNYGNGRKLSVAQDAKRLRPSERLVGGADFPMQLRYAYDGANNLTQISDLQNSAYTQVLGYDGLNRLTSAKGIWGTATYAYNVRGDLASQSIAGRSIAYGYDAQGRLSSLSGGLVAGLSYDAKGNVLKARGEYGYDLAGNMTRLCLSPHSNCASAPDQRYAYDARQRRTLLTDAAGRQQVHIYGQGGQLLREDDLSSGNIKEYIYVATERIAHREQCSDADTDADGMPDCYESRQGFDPRNPADGKADSDGDSLSNAEEYRLGTKVRNPDSDNDGMPDGWEVRYKLDPKNPADAYGDLDGNGVTNLDSYLQGKPPINLWPAIMPVINGIILN